MVENSLEDAAGHTPPLAPPVGVEASAGDDAVGGGDLVFAAALKIVHGVWLSAAYLGSFRCSSGIDERMRAISARRASPSGTGGTGTPPTLNLHAPGTRISGGAGYSVL